MLPEHAPFTPDQRNALSALLPGLNATQKSWLSGFLAASGDAIVSPAQAASNGKLTVLYGTESGNSEALADRAVKEAKKRGFAATMRNMADLSPADLTKLENLVVIVSTWGDGDPPETAAAFYKDFMSTEVKFSSTRFSVCALGDTS